MRLALPMLPCQRQSPLRGKHEGSEGRVTSHKPVYQLPPLMEPPALCHEKEQPPCCAKRRKGCDAVMDSRSVSPGALAKVAELPSK